MAKTLFAFVVLMTIQYAFSAPFSFNWCALPKEKIKCNEFVKYVNETAQNISLDVTASCVNGSSTEDCMTKIKDGQADLVTLNGGKVYTAGKSYNLVPIVSEKYGQYGVKYFAVALVKKNNTGFDIKTLKGKKTCHTGARKIAGWIVPIGYLLRTEIIPALACGNVNNDLISFSKYVDKSCVPGAPSEFSNLCALCAGTGADKCSLDSTKNKYAGYTGAFMCMAEGKGDVAFAKHTTAQEVVDMGNHGKLTDYEYLCKDGGRKAIGNHETCNLGNNPAHAVVTRMCNKNILSIIKILMAMSDRYGDKQKDWSKFQLFNSTNYRYSNLIFKDSTTELKAIPTDDQTYIRYLGEGNVKDREALVSCDFLGTTPRPITAGTTPRPITASSTPHPITASTTPRPITAVSTVTTPVTVLALLIALFSILLL